MTAVAKIVGKVSGFSLSQSRSKQQDENHVGGNPNNSLEEREHLESEIHVTVGEGRSSRFTERVE